MIPTLRPARLARNAPRTPRPSAFRLAPVLLAVGLPLLCLPFHLLFLGCLLLFGVLGPRLVVPLEVAVGSPEEMRRWHLRREITEECWETIARGAAAGQAFQPDFWKRASGWKA